MLCFGFFALARLGVTCPLIMEIGRIPTDVSVDGEIRESGRGFWKDWLIILILNG
jgi:hypothetical protein